MDIHLNREGLQLDPRSLDEVIADVRNGELDPHRDLAWIDGMGDKWERLGFVLDLYCLPNREAPPFSLQDILSPRPEEPVLAEVPHATVDATENELTAPSDAEPKVALSWLMPAFCATLLGLLAVMAFVSFPYAEIDHAFEVLEGVKKNRPDAKIMIDAVWTAFQAQVSISALLWSLMGFACVPLASLFRLENKGWGSVTIYVAATFALTVGCHYWRYLEGLEMIRLLPDITSDQANHATKMVFLQTIGRLLLTWLVEPALSLLAAFVIFQRPAMWVVIFWFMAGFINAMIAAVISMIFSVPDFK